MADEDVNEVKKAEESSESSSDSSSDDDADMDSNSDGAKDSEDNVMDASSDDEIDIGPNPDETIENYETDLKKNPYLYDRHVQLIKIYRKLGRLDKLDEARERMYTSYPLSPKLWLSWLKDAQRKNETKEDHEKIISLFKRACGDYQSVEVWLDYCSFAIGIMQEKGDEWVRSVFEEALSRVGGHISKGGQVWAAFRDFEMIRLAQAPKELNPKKQCPVDEQCEAIAKLFRRELSLPLRGMDEVMEEYKDWMSSVPQEVKSSFDRAKIYLQEADPLIEAIEDAESDEDRYKAHLAFIDFTERKGIPSRIICAYEEAVTDSCLRADLWQRYLTFLTKNFLTDANILPQCRRAVRNCPWSLELWMTEAECLERFKKDHTSIQSTYETALNAGFTESSHFLRLWTEYTAYLRRRVDWGKSVEELGRSKEVEALRDTFERAIISMEKYFNTFGDPQCSLFRFWAFVEAKLLKNLPKARELWSEVMMRNHGNEAHMWLEYIAFERAYGDAKHCRKVLARAINSVTDWPEHVFDACLRFEREEGSLDTLIEVRTKIEQQRARLADRAAAAEAKEKAAKKSAQQEKAAKRGQKRSAKPETSAQNIFNPSIDIRPSKRTKQEVSPEPEPEPSQTKDSEGFVVPSPPKPSSPHAKSAPPPGFLAHKQRQLEEQKKAEADSAGDSTIEAEHGTTIEHDVNKEFRTIFVSNLDYNVKQSVIEEIFKKCGELNEVRLVRDHRGRSKGYAYVEFKSGDPVKAALECDRTLVEGRPMFVSECNPNRRHEFQYATGLEKNKLFVKNLPKNITKHALETMFSEYGKLGAVRLATFRNGSPKGHAYIEFTNDNDASRALVGLDGQTVGENTISVALSNPPKRREPALGVPILPVVEPSLGGGKRQTTDHGKARTQISLVPRTVIKKEVNQPNVKRPVVTTSAADSGDSSTKSTSVTAEGPSTSTNGAENPLSIKKSAGLSNEEFRKLFMKK